MILFRHLYSFLIEVIPQGNPWYTHLDLGFQSPSLGLRRMGRMGILGANLVFTFMDGIFGESTHLALGLVS